MLALKRVGWPLGERGGGGGGGGGNKPTTRSMIKLSPKTVERRVDVLVVSDAYVGMDWRIEGVEIPAVPVVEEGVGKKEV